MISSYLCTNKCIMDIKETFLKLTSRTYPHGTESEVMHLLPQLDTDEFGNRFIQIGESPSCMFTSHLDTATSANTPVEHIINGDIIKTDGFSILGADDKAGVTVMLHMIENKVPGLYYFFLGEEVGCIGSKKLSGKFATDKIEYINKVISFDRRGYDSVITFQSSSRCCSDVFATALAGELNKNEVAFGYKPDPTGIYTDSAQFTRIYPECTNISVGYKSEHTFSEQQDIAHLELLANACVSINWDKLPVERDPSVVEYTKSNYYYYGGNSDGYGWGGWGDYDDYGCGSDDSTYTKPITKVTTFDNESLDESVYFMDPTYNYVSGVKMKKYSGVIITVDFAKERIEDEKVLIHDFLFSLEIEYDSIEWDGFKLVVNYTAGHKTECNRTELAEFLPDLDFWKEEIKSYKGESIY